VSFALGAALGAVRRNLISPSLVDLPARFFSGAPRNVDYRCSAPEGAIDFETFAIAKAMP
jgi:hypothetical protein